MYDPYKETTEDDVRPIVRAMFNQFAPSHAQQLFPTSWANLRVLLTECLNDTKDNMTNVANSLFVHRKSHNNTFFASSFMKILAGSFHIKHQISNYVQLNSETLRHYLLIPADILSAD